MIGTLGYNSSNDRYGLLICDLWEIEGFHCGQNLEVWDSESERWLPTRMEMHYQPSAFQFPAQRNDGWYLAGTEYSGTDLEGLRVRVSD